MKQNNFSTIVTQQHHSWVPLLVRWQESNIKADPGCRTLIGRVTHQVVCHVVYPHKPKSSFWGQIWFHFLHLGKVSWQTGWTLVRVIRHGLKCHIIPVHPYDWRWVYHAYTNKHAPACFPGRRLQQQTLVLQTMAGRCRDGSFILYSTCKYHQWETTKI